MQLILQKIIFFLFLLTGYLAGAQVKFSATVSPAEIGKNEYTQLKLMVENAIEVEQIQPPPLKNFIILSGPNQESGMSMVNGNVKKYIALTYVISPKRVGSFIIPPALAKADGKDYKSNAVTLKVTVTGSGNHQAANAFNIPFSGIDPFSEAVPQPSYKDFILEKGENPLDKIKKNMFVNLEVDKTSCYVGEPVIATYKLYTRLKSESNLTKNPSFNGFSVIDLQQQENMSYRTEKLEGREYNVYIIRKVQLYPLLAGNLELGTAEIENSVRFARAEYLNQDPGIFNNMFQDIDGASIPAQGMENYKLTLQNKPLAILVRPLPEINKPINFKGAVGKYIVETKAEKNNFSTDDAGKFVVVISGEGNLQMINVPEITWPEGIEGYDCKITDDLYKGTVPVSGRKIFEFPFTVARPGTFVIPAFDFCFFDNRESKYRTVATNPLQITVTKGTGKRPEIISNGNSQVKDSVIARFFNNRLRVVSLIAILIIGSLIFWLKRDTKKEKLSKAPVIVFEETGAEDKPAEEIILGQFNHLKMAEASLQREDARPDDSAGRGKSFYIELNQAFKSYLSKKLSIPPEELNKKNISEQLDKIGVTHETSIQVHRLMDEIEWNLYTPFAENEKMKGIYEKASELIQLLNTYRNQENVNL